jgi:hypothetical protein
VTAARAVGPFRFLAAAAAPGAPTRLSGLTGILLTQRMVTSPEPTELVTDFWAAYASIDA